MKLSVPRATRGRRIASASAALGCAAAVVLTGCSSSGGHKGGGSPSASGTAADAATRTAVTAAYETFFGYKSTSAQSQAVLQHGPSFTTTLAEQAKSSYAQKSTVQVTAVRLLGKDVADVTFTIASNGTAVLPDSDGRAVRENGRWKVAAKTFCTLIALQGTPPTACKDPKITALPN